MTRKQIIKRQSDLKKAKAWLSQLSQLVEKEQFDDLDYLDIQWELDNKALEIYKRYHSPTKDEQ